MTYQGSFLQDSGRPQPRGGAHDNSTGFSSGLPTDDFPPLCTCDLLKRRSSFANTDKGLYRAQHTRRLGKKPRQGLGFNKGGWLKTGNVNWATSQLNL